MKTRRYLIGLLAVVVLAILAIVFIPQLLQQLKPTYYPTQGWRSSTPEEQGFDSGKLAEMLQAIQERNIELDSLLLIRNGYVLLDAYRYPYDGTFPHNLASVTKSVMTTLIAIAADQGKLQLDQPMISYFPDRTIANLDSRKEHITVRHLTGMVNGFESGCLSGDQETIAAMQATPDWVQAALDREMIREPGEIFCYDSPGMHLLSAILQNVTGMTALDFAKQNLFEPLGIREVIWDDDPQGYTFGLGDLHLKPRDAAKIGYLWLNNGVWEGKQIVSAKWVEDAVKPHTAAGEDYYGYGWWYSEGSYWALGRGGQYIKLYPSINTILVITASNFEIDQIEMLLEASFVDPDKPLPANPASVAKLDETVAALVQPPQPLPIGPLPEIAKEISGKTYVFESNPAQVITMRYEFEDASEAKLYLKLESGEEIWPVGLDGKFRISSEGRVSRGYWADPQTFVLEVFEKGLVSYRCFFEDDRLVINSPELGFEFEGQSAP